MTIAHRREVVNEISESGILAATNIETDEYSELLAQLNNYYNSYSFNPKSLVGALKAKVEYHKTLFEETAEIKIPSIKKNSQKVNEYKNQMYKKLLNNVKSHRSSYPEDIFVDEELIITANKTIVNNEFDKLFELLNKNNSLYKNISEVEVKIGKKRFGKGAKLTRILSLFLETTRLNYIKDNILNNLMPDEKAMGDIYLSINPAATFMMGLIAGSCVSPWGDNFHTTLNFIGVRQQMVAYNEEKTWRANLLVDHSEKLFYLGTGYPYHNYTNEMAIVNFFHERGYKATLSTDADEYFYFSNDSRLDEKEDFSFIELDIYADETLTGIQHHHPDIFCPYFFLDAWCEDGITLDPCEEGSHEGRVWSDYYDDYISEEDAAYAWWLDEYLYYDSGFEDVSERNRYSLKQTYYTILSERAINIIDSGNATLYLELEKDEKEYETNYLHNALTELFESEVPVKEFVETIYELFWDGSHRDESIADITYYEALKYYIMP